MRAFQSTYVGRNDIPKSLPDFLLQQWFTFMLAAGARLIDPCCLLGRVQRCGCCSAEGRSKLSCQKARLQDDLTAGRKAASVHHFHIREIYFYILH